MNRRRFISLSTLTAIGWSTTPSNAKEWAYIGEKGKMLGNAWKVKDTKEVPVTLTKKDKVINNPWKLEDVRNINEIIVALYGEAKVIIRSNKVKIKAPKLAENAYSIPLNISTTLNAKKILIIQVANKYALSGIFEVPKDVIVNYSLRVKQRQTGYITVVIEDINGLLYKNDFEIDVMTGGGCGG